MKLLFFILFSISIYFSYSAFHKLIEIYNMKKDYTVKVLLGALINTVMSIAILCTFIKANFKFMIAMVLLIIIFDIMLKLEKKEIK